MGDYSKLDCKVILKKKYVKEIAKLYKYPRVSNLSKSITDLNGRVFRRIKTYRTSSIPFAPLDCFPEIDDENILYLDRRLWSFRCSLKDYVDESTGKTPYMEFINILEEIAEKVIYLEIHCPYFEWAGLYEMNDKGKIIEIQKAIFRGYELDYDDMPDYEKPNYYTEDDFIGIDSKYRKGPFIDYYEKHNISKQVGCKIW